MKKVITLLISLILTVGLFGGAVFYQIDQDTAGIYQGNFSLPGIFPSKPVLITIQIILFFLMGITYYYIAQKQVNANRQKNVFINSFIFLGTIFSWNYLLFSTGNLTGSLVISIAGLILGLIVLSMTWLVDHKAGYLMIPTNFWSVMMIILSIFLMVRN